VQHAYGLEIPETVEEVLRPDRCALLVYDLQAGIVPHVRDREAFVSRVLEAIAAARAARMRVVFCRHVSLPNELSGVFQLRTAMAWQRVASVGEVQSLFQPGSPGHELIREVEPQASEAVFDKLAMSMFEGTPLELVLRDCNLNAFAIVGAVTEIGIEPTVRHGCDLGFIPVVLRDGCGSVDEEAGRRSLESLDYAAMSLQTDVATFVRVLGSG
jgi:biuret amidohydrolase